MNFPITGQVAFEKDVPPFSNANVHITLEEVTRIDAPSKLIAEVVLSSVSSSQLSNGRVFFTIPADKVKQDIDPQADYIISVHVDTDQDGKISKGDFITTQSFPALTNGNPSHVEIQVKKI